MLIEHLSSNISLLNVMRYSFQNLQLSLNLHIIMDIDLLEWMMNVPSWMNENECSSWDSLDLSSVPRAKRRHPSTHSDFSLQFKYSRYVQRESIWLWYTFRISLSISTFRSWDSNEICHRLLMNSFSCEFCSFRAPTWSISSLSLTMI